MTPSSCHKRVAREAGQCVLHLTVLLFLTLQHCVCVCVCVCV